MLQGLSLPLNALSFEYSPEYMQSTLDCIRRLVTFGSFTFNYSPAEEMVLALPTWVNADEISRVMTTMPVEQPYGDVYARFEGHS